MSCLAIGKNMYRDEPLSEHSTFKIGGQALYYAEPADREELAFFFDLAGRESLPWVLIGNASNLLFADEGYDGLVISLSRFECDRFEVEDTRVNVSSGMGLTRLARLLAEHSLGGMEFVGTIPGTVGGALAMNASFGRSHARPQAMSDTLVQVEIMEDSGKLLVMKPNEIEFSYRWSSLQGKVITGAVFGLEARPQEEIRSELRANQKYRARTQDLRFPSAGSVFKNPAGFAQTAGRMIDLVNLRGSRVGDAQISEKHGNFIVNRGGARAGDVLELIDHARSKVKQAFGVELELEVKYIRSLAS
jgi:UDP-N-acetylmuramate dehydrogenase